MSQQQQKKQRFAHQVNQIAKFLKQKGALYIVLISLVWVFTPFLHVPYLNSDVEGILGFKWMTSFLFALIVPFSFLCGAFFVYDLAKHAPPLKQKYSNRLSQILSFNGVFFLLWTFYPMTGDFEWYVYHPVLIGLSIAFARYSKKVYEFFIVTEEKLKYKIKTAKSVISGFVELFLKWEYRTDDPNEFRDDWYKKSKESGLFK